MARLDVCNHCNGSGLVTLNASGSDPLAHWVEARPCPSCHGSGSVESWRQPTVGPFAQYGFNSVILYWEEASAMRAMIRRRDGC